MAGHRKVEDLDHKKDQTLSPISLKNGKPDSDAPLVTLEPRAPLMGHEDRLKLIRTSFQSQRIPSKTWGGVNVGNAGSVPTEGHRTWQLSAADESYLRYGRRDDEQGD